MEILFNLENLGFSFLAVATIAFLAIILSSYVKLVTVLSIVRAGLGAHSLPSAFVTTGLALMLSALVMYPTIENTLQAMNESHQSNKDLLADNKNQLSFVTLNSGVLVWKDFLKKHTGPEEKKQFTKVAEELDKQTKQDKSLTDSFRVLAPAFIVTELKAAFATGLNLFLPFLIIELLIAHLLVSLGISQLNVSFVSLPFKLLLFVMVDGWTLITTNLILTYS